MVWTPPHNVRYSLGDEDLPVDTRQVEKRKIATIMEEPSDGIRDKNMAEDRHIWGLKIDTYGCQEYRFR